MEGLALSEFIRTTLTSVAAGVKLANDDLALPDRYFTLGAAAAGKRSAISFDIALTVSDGQRDKGGFMVALASIGAGASTEKSASADRTHRIQFEVALRYEMN